MGLPVRIRLYGPTDEVAKTVAAAAFARVAVLDQMMSDCRPESELRRLGTARDRWSVVSPDLFAVLKRAAEIARATGGAFDSTVGPLVALWRDARQSRRMPDRVALASAKRLLGWRDTFVSTRRAARSASPCKACVSISAASPKAYILQQALGSMASLGVTQAFVEAGATSSSATFLQVAMAGASMCRYPDGGFAARAARLTNRALATPGPRRSSSRSAAYDTRTASIREPAGA